MLYLQWNPAFFFFPDMKRFRLRALPFALLFALFSAHTFPVTAQQQGTAPQESALLFETADEIAIYTPDSLAVALRTIQGLLQQTGFTLDTTITNVDNSRFLVRTRGLTISSVRFNRSPSGIAYAKAYVTAQGTGARVLLTGFCLPQSRMKYKRKVAMDAAYYQGSEFGHRKAAFLHLQAIALAYPQGRVVYRAGWESEFR